MHQHTEILVLIYASVHSVVPCTSLIYCSMEMGYFIIPWFTAVDDGSQTYYIVKSNHDICVWITHLGFYKVLTAGCKLKNKFSVSHPVVASVCMCVCVCSLTHLGFFRFYDSPHRLLHQQNLQRSRGRKTRRGRRGGGEQNRIGEKFLDKVRRAEPRNNDQWCPSHNE